MGIIAWDLGAGFSFVEPVRNGRLTVRCPYQIRLCAAIDRRSTHRTICKILEIARTNLEPVGESKVFNRLLVREVGVKGKCGRGVVDQPNAQTATPIVQEWPSSSPHDGGD